MILTKSPLFSHPDFQTNFILYVERFRQMRNESPDMLKNDEMPLAAAIIQRFLNEMKENRWCAHIICIWWCVQCHRHLLSVERFSSLLIRCGACELFSFLYLSLSQCIRGSGVVYHSCHRHIVLLHVRWGFSCVYSILVHLFVCCCETERKNDWPILVELSIVHFSGDKHMKQNVWQNIC